MKIYCFFEKSVNLLAHDQYLNHGRAQDIHELPIHSTSFQSTSSHDIHLLSLLRQRKTEEAYQAYTRCPHLPSSTCLSRLLAQLSYQNTPAAFARAQALVRRGGDERQLHRLDANSLSLLAVTTAGSGATLYAVSVIRTMLCSGYLPHVNTWSAVVSRLAAAPDDGPTEALRLLDADLRRVRRIPGDAAADARPDTAAFNAALNAAANLGDVRRFAQLFDEMSEFGAEPDVLTYNVFIKMLARAERKDLLAFALERIIRRELVPCITTLHSLVAAYVGFGDLETGERLVQAMREGRRHLCSILRDSNDEEPTDRSDEEAHTLLEKLVTVNANSGDANDDDDPPPLLPKTYTRLQDLHYIDERVHERRPHR